MGLGSAGALLICMTNAMNLADILRTFNPRATRQDLKVARAALRRAGVTNLNHARRNAPYRVAPDAGRVTDARALAGCVVAAVAAEIAS